MITTKPAAPWSALRNFIASEAAGGMLLIAAAILAMLAANHPWSADAYHAVLHAQAGPVLNAKLGPMTPHLWINDGLMAMYFLLVGLEIKRECVDGRLSSWSRRRLPMIAAASGMIVPALIYLALTNGERALQRGWAIPAATDIAFALAVLALLGNRAPTSLKLLLLTIAIVDDMGAVAIIAVAYTDTLNLSALAGAAAIMLAMHVLARGRVTLLWPYLLCAALLWYAVLLSGIHATIAGVLAAFMMPVTPTPGQPDAKDSVLHRAENILHPWSAYLIVPLFGFANAGVPLHGLGAGALMSPLPLAIAAGLVLGKQMGIFGSIWLCVRCGIATMPRGATWAQIYGLSVLCGIGFTMSLFIGALAFPGSPELVEAAKVGTLAGSMIAAVMGYSVLRRAALHPDHEAIEAAQTHEIDADGDVAQ